MPEMRDGGAGPSSRPYQAAWPDLFANLQEAYSELTHAQFELEQRTREVSEARDLFERVIEAMSEGLFLLDRSGRIVEANHAAAGLLDCAPESLIGLPFDEAWGNRELAATPWEISSRAPAGRLMGLEVAYRSKRGKTGFASVSCSLVRDRSQRITGVLIVVRDITSQKEDRDRLQASLREKDLLLKEIHHRVKNNLQVISSLLNLQSVHIGDPGALEMFRDSQSRVRSMALVHEKLYQSRDLGSVDFERYVRDLGAYLFRMYGVDPDRQRLRLAIENVVFGIDVAVPCGLILNELVSNCLKHAFPEGRRGEIEIALQKDGNRFILIVRDDGVGFPTEINFEASETLGLQLVHTLARQLEGAAELGSGSGTEVRVVFAAE